jgi:hypothetical protein
MAGNYLVFRAPVDLEEPSGISEGGQAKSWGQLLTDRQMTPGKQSADDRLIPLPTAGVFAEAVLGRSNAAEKLDVTRFWNWQDSPIPLTPTDIAPVGMGSRGTAEDLKPGQLGQPVLNIVNPPALPNPTGVGAVLGAVATPNMFRDMSGLAGTQGLVQTGMQETLQAATDAGQLASANMRTEAQKAVAMGQIAADIVKSVMGGGGGSSASQGISGAGAMINHGKSMDKIAPSSSAGGSGGMSTGSSTTNEQAAFDRAVWGPLGESGTAAAGETLAQAMGLQNVGDHYVPPATSPTHPRSFELSAMAGEQILANTLESEGLIVFRDWTKNVSAKGIDLVALDPKTGTVWLLDNKAQFASDISGANALTGKEFGTYLEETKAFLGRTSPHPRAAEALAAIEKGNYIRVVGNAWAKASRRFTPGLFAKGLKVYDVRLRRLFSDHASWEAAFSAFLKLRGVRRMRGVRGAATIDGMIMVLIVSGSTLYALRSGEDVKQMLGELVAESALGAILSRLPGGFVAGFTLGLKSDRSAEGQAAYERSQTIDTILASWPEYSKLSEAEQKQAREEIGKMLDDPIKIDPPPAPAAPAPAPATPLPPRGPSNEDSGGGGGTPFPPSGPPGWGGGSA